MASYNPNQTKISRAHQAELKVLHTKSANVTSELSGSTLTGSVSRTREMLKSVNESKDVGQNTLQSLYEQGDSLNRTERGLDETSENLDKAAIRLKNMKRASRAPCCCLPCISWFQRDPEHSHRRSVLVNQIQNEKRKANFTEASTDFPPRNNGVKSNDDVRFFPKVLGTEDEEEIENNLTHVSHHLTNLKGIAVEMGTEVDRQNEQIDGLNDKAEKSTVKVHEATKNTKDLINDNGTSTTTCCCCG